MNNSIELENLIGKSKQEINYVRNLCQVMEKVGGYKQLMNLPVSAINVILKYMEWANKEQERMTKQRGRR